MEKCECGSTSFRVDRSQTVATYLDDGRLYQSMILNSAIDIIECSECEKEYSPSDFDGIYIKE